MTDVADKMIEAAQIIDKAKKYKPKVAVKEGESRFKAKKPDKGMSAYEAYRRIHKNRSYVGNPHYEELILTSINIATDYANYILHKRFKPVEDLIIKELREIDYEVMFHNKTAFKSTVAHATRYTSVLKHADENSENEDRWEELEAELVRTTELFLSKQLEVRNNNLQINELEAAEIILEFLEDYVESINSVEAKNKFLSVLETIVLSLNLESYRNHEDKVYDKKIAAILFYYVKVIRKPNERIETVLIKGLKEEAIRKNKILKAREEGREIEIPRSNSLTNEWLYGRYEENCKEGNWQEYRDELEKHPYAFMSTLFDLIAEGHDIKEENKEECFFWMVQAMKADNCTAFYRWQFGWTIEKFIKATKGGTEYVEKMIVASGRVSLAEVYARHLVKFKKGE
jgi:hypothetical protein